MIKVSTLWYFIFNPKWK